MQLADRTQKGVFTGLLPQDSAAIPTLCLSIEAFSLHCHPGNFYSRIYPHLGKYYNVSPIAHMKNDRYYLVS